MAWTSRGWVTAMEEGKTENDTSRQGQEDRQAANGIEEEKAKAVPTHLLLHTWESKQSEFEYKKAVVADDDNQRGDKGGGATQYDQSFLQELKKAEAEFGLKWEIKQVYWVPARRGPILEEEKNKKKKGRGCVIM